MFLNCTILNTKKIVITGGPGTGKSSVIAELERRGQVCFEEISRQVTLEARKNGVEQLFLTQPLLFSQLLLEGRANQFDEAERLDNTTVFMDRGIPDVLAYMNFYGSDYPDSFINVCENKVYDMVFILSPWQEIFKRDSVRYESFEQSQLIHEHLVAIYKKFNYQLIDIPFGTVESRVDYIMHFLNQP